MGLASTIKDKGRICAQNKDTDLTPRPRARASASESVASPAPAAPNH